MTVFSLRSLCAAAGTIAVLAVSAQAAVFGPLTFSSAADYTSNFTGGLGGTRYAVDEAASVLRYSATSTADSGTSVTRYTPANDFRTETVSTNLTFADFRSAPSFGVFTRVQSNGLGVLALLNVGDSATGTTGSVRIRLNYAADTASAGIGTNFFDQTFSGLTNTIATGQPLTYVLTQTADSKFSLTLSDGEGLVAATGDQTLPTAAVSTYGNAGGLALRSSASFTPNNIAIDNLAAVPEPTTLAALGLGAAALLRRRRA